MNLDSSTVWLHFHYGECLFLRNCCPYGVSNHPMGCLLYGSQYSVFVVMCKRGIDA